MISWAEQDHTDREPPTIHLRLGASPTYLDRLAAACDLAARSLAAHAAPGPLPPVVAHRARLEAWLAGGEEGR